MLLTSLRWSFFYLFDCNSIEEPPAMGRIMLMVGKGVCWFSWFSGLGSFLGAIVCTGEAEAMPLVVHRALVVAEWFQ